MSCQTVNGGIFAGASVPRYQKVDRTGDKKENKNRKELIQNRKSRKQKRKKYTRP